MLKDMALGPPSLSIIFLDRNCPMAKNSAIGRIQDSRKLSSGEVSSMISLENTAPAS